MRRFVLVVLAGGALIFSTAVAGSATTDPTGYGPGPPTWRSNWFQSPTRNIKCRYYPSRQYVVCRTSNNGVLAGVTLYGQSYRRYDGYRFYFPGGPILSYGQAWTVAGRFRCISRYNGMTCRSLQTGRGFFINRDYTRLF